MQSSSTALQDAIKQDYEVNSSIRVIAEWNQNRFATIKNIVNDTSLGSVTITGSSGVLTTSSSHGLVEHDRILLGAISGVTGITSGITYYVLTAPTATTLTISATFGGAPLAFSVGGSTSTTLYKVLEDYNSEMFPIESIALPDRPDRGILKARAADRIQVSNLGAESWTNSGYEDTPDGARYGTANIDSLYKYWTSPFESVGSYLDTPAAIDSCSPSVVYTEVRNCNKIVIGFESSYAEPSAYTVQITTDGTTWSTVATTPTIDATTGKVELYRQSGGTWSQTVNYDYPTQIQGVKINVTQMNRSKVFFNLIELSLRLEADLSPYVVSASIDNSMSETSFVTPLGTSSANTGTIELSNAETGYFSNDNVSSPYYNMIDRNVDFSIDEGTNLGTLASPNFEWIRMATMKSGPWSGQARDIASVSLSDDAVRLQALKPNPVFYQSMTIGEILWRLLDSVGFSNYSYDVSDKASTLIPYFWADGTKTIWQVINELTQATQTAVFFDEYNTLHIQTRDAAFDLAKTAAPSWTFNYSTNGSDLPDIISATKTYDYEGNTVNTTYVTAKLSDVSTSGDGIPIMEKVWEPEGDLVLRSTVLKGPLTTTSYFGSFDPTYMDVWPFSGIIQVEGEFIRYTKKGYCYYNAAGSLIYAWVTSNDEKLVLDKINPQLSYRNYYNGNLYFGVENRGIWNSVPKNHSVDVTGYNTRYRTLGGPISSWSGGFIHDKNRGVLRLATNGGFTPNSWYTAIRGNSFDQMPYHYGTRLQFPGSGYGWGVGGLVVGAGSNDAGYYIEVNRTVAVTDRKDTNEIAFYIRHTDGSILRVAGKGLPYAVGVRQWVDIDVSVSFPGSSAIDFTIVINGTLVWMVHVDSAQRPIPTFSGAFGLFVRGDTIADFEYLYASTYDGGAEDQLDEAGYFDRIAGGYQSSQLMREWTYGWRKTYRIVKGKKEYYYQKYNQTIIDDFSPVAHEVREFDVKFTKVPVLNSNLYSSNEAQIICPEYLSNPFGAKFILANTARVNAMAQGEDTLTFGADSAVTQHCLIYGRTVTTSDAQILTVTDLAGIRRRGPVVVDITSPWIQSEAAAKAIGDWIILHWSQGSDEVEMEVFGNPLIQLGDVVAVNYAPLSMNASTHKYFVTKVSQSYTAGLSTTLTLRRAVSV